MRKKRSTEEKDNCLQMIANFMLKKPLLTEDTSSFISFVAKELNLSNSQAKKYILEVKRRKREASIIDLQAEIAKKKNEYAFIKEEALRQNNLNAYLGAVNKEAEMLAIKKYTIFNENDEEEVSNLEEKKALLLKKLFPLNEDEKTED